MERYGILYLYVIVGIMIPFHSTLIPLVKFVASVNGYNSYSTIVVIYSTFHIPFAVFLITGYIRGLNKEIDESALVDGCGPVRYLFSFVIPICMPIISTTAILTFLFTYNELIFAVLFLTKKEMYTISLSMLSFVGERSVEMGPIFAAIVIAILPMIAVYLLMQEKVIGGLSSGAVKG
ncbi:carbohydrate ABC transporter permease [Paenibacillus sp. LjRoot153]|uniref:carbohydrate ABC transporter permease n=1 Tax=Paenibacillus sp. LjRoot153 TaxID=3342270 RepID=UPI003ED10450